MTKLIIALLCAGILSAQTQTITVLPGQTITIVSPPLAPSSSASFTSATAGMKVLKDYEFGCGTGRNVCSIADLAKSFNPYAIAGTTPINNEWERYQAFNATNFVFGPSSLALTATAPGGLVNGGINSGQIASQATYQPGVTGFDVYAFEFRAQIPAGPGMWPAMWFYPKTPGNNIDGSEIDTEFFVMQWQNTYDWTGFNHGPQAGADVYSIQTNEWVWHPGTDFSAAFHSYQFYWTRSTIYKYVDGLLVKQTPFVWTAGTSTQPNPAQFIVNLAVGSDTVGPGLLPTSTTQFPAKFSIDHIKVWAK